MISQILYQVLQNFILDGILSSYKVILKEKNNSNHNDNKNYEKKSKNDGKEENKALQSNLLF